MSKILLFLSNGNFLFNIFFSFKGWKIVERKYPSIREQFGYVALEMMNSQLPIVASNTEGLMDILEHYKSALLVSMVFNEEKHMTPNVVEMGGHIIKLLKDTKLSNSLIEFSKRRVENDFSTRNMINNYTKLANF